MIVKAKTELIWHEANEKYYTRATDHGNTNPKWYYGPQMNTNLNQVVSIERKAAEVLEKEYQSCFK